MEIVHGIRDLFLLRNLPALGPGTGLGALFLFGFLTSFHCMGMCGGIALSQGIQGSQVNNGKSGFSSSIRYQAGRLASYTFVGGIAGGIGMAVRLPGILKGLVPVFGGVFMVVMALNLLGTFPVLRRLNLHMPKWVGKKVLDHPNRPLYVGLLSGLMPCGPLQIVQLYALGSGSILQGATTLFIFTLGTMPVLFLFGNVHRWLGHRHIRRITQASAIIVAIMGIFMVHRGLLLSGVNLPSFGSGGETVTSQAATGSYEKANGITTGTVVPENPAGTGVQGNVTGTDVQGNVSGTDAQVNQDGPGVSMNTSSSAKCEEGGDANCENMKQKGGMIQTTAGGIDAVSGTASVKTEETESGAETGPDTAMPEAPSKTAPSIASEPPVQYVKTELQDNAYPHIVVKAGIPVEWNMHAEEAHLNSCNNALTIPAYGVTQALAAGDNLIRFLPEKPGTYSYTCWMGMIEGRITVVEE